MKPGQFEYRTGLLHIIYAGIVILVAQNDYFLINAGAVLCFIGLGYYAIGHYYEGPIR